jgi:hypothetical protein
VLLLAVYAATTTTTASAFHPSFTDKMFAMAQDGTEFPACIIVRKGLEGTLASGTTVHTLTRTKLTHTTWHSTLLF